MYNLHVLAPVFSENSVDLVAKEKGISRAQRLCTAKKIILAPGRRWAGEPTPRTSASPYRREHTWSESLQLWRNEEQLITGAEQLRRSQASSKNP